MDILEIRKRAKKARLEEQEEHTKLPSSAGIVEHGAVLEDAYSPEVPQPAAAKSPKTFSDALPSELVEEFGQPFEEKPFVDPTPSSSRSQRAPEPPPPPVESFYEHPAEVEPQKETVKKAAVAEDKLESKTSAPLQPPSESDTEVVPKKPKNQTSSFLLSEIENEKEGRAKIALEKDRDEDPLSDFLVRYDENEEKRRIGTAQATSLHHRYLAFSLEKEQYAASIMDVREIVTVSNITEIPRTPPFILGVFSKRGVVMPVMELGAILGLRSSNQDQSAGQRVLVVGESDRLCGLRVDTLRQTIQLTADSIEPMPTGGDTRTALLLTGLGKVSDDNLYILLDIAALLDHVDSMVADSLGLKRGGR
ncbi:MAG: purine-binding chemotaxis protein CheW [Deltaproteobacteria bacterium]|nr:purine-binding chemotaxis protein CheW [Deltaproteobacteria bacterium]